MGDVERSPVEKGKGKRPAGGSKRPFGTWVKGVAFVRKEGGGVYFYITLGPRGKKGGLSRITQRRGGEVAALKKCHFLRK